MRLTLQKLELNDALTVLLNSYNLVFIFIGIILLTVMENFTTTRMDSVEYCDRNDVILMSLYKGRSHKVLQLKHQFIFDRSW